MKSLYLKCTVIMLCPELVLIGILASCRYFHVGDSHRGYLGTGSVDWTRMWGGLVAADFKGPITFESFSSAVVSPTLSKTLCVWRDL